MGQSRVPVCGSPIVDAATNCCSVQMPHALPLDNNASERSLRRVALGRKNYLFVGDVDAGMSIAGLYTLVATCEALGINPFAYLDDVIPRVQDHPKRRLDELLPGPWSRARGDA